MRHAARQFLAGLHAAAAAFRADAAMFMHSGVRLALLGAQPAGGGADAEHAAHHFVIETGPAGHDAAGDVADVGAPDANVAQDTNWRTLVPHHGIPTTNGQTVRELLKLAS